MSKTVAIIGAGPAGLFAAELASRWGAKTTVYDHMPSPGRKFLMAGRGGLNLTHSEPLDRFIARYGDAAGWIGPMVRAFPPAALMAWCEGLGQPVFTGSSGRVFPVAMKASPLLRAWLSRLEPQGVEIRLRHRWTGWDAQNRQTFAAPGGPVAIQADATVLALGGGSWPRLGSDGGWRDILAARGVASRPFAPANCGFHAAFSEAFLERFAGAPLTGIALSAGGTSVRGEATVTRQGLEGGAVYALSAALRDAIARDGAAEVLIDLRPGLSVERVAERLTSVRGGESFANTMRKALALPPVAAHLLREAYADPRAGGPAALAQRVKGVPVRLTAAAGLERAISSAGGLTREQLDPGLSLRALPNIYATGEMLDWEAPTGGYLLQACFASAHHAARDAAKRLGLTPVPAI
jgi:hypothetical protein